MRVIYSIVNSEPECMISDFMVQFLDVIVTSSQPRGVT